MKVFVAVTVLFALWAGLASAQQAEPHGPGQSLSDDVFLSEIPDYAGNVILARPTNQSITLSIFAREARRVDVVYREKEEDRTLRTGPIDLAADRASEVLIEGLKADTAYEYRILESPADGPQFLSLGSGTWHTSRTPGSEFTFTVQADAHLDGSCRPKLNEQCLANALADRPDFHIDLGDTFMTGKHPDRESAAWQYAAQRYFLGLIGHSVPVFLVLGNHDGEEVAKRGAAQEGGLAVWSNQQRKALFPNPEPDEFFSGNATKHPIAGHLQDYYAWQWGDALFVVLDPYWYSMSTRGGTQRWNATIGRTQYEWLTTVLRRSPARHKFVFIHQLTGGVDASGRGGTEAAALFEWGGHNLDGSDGFRQNRPGWEQPIHDLLVETGVEVVFHGHDHFFACQSLDGVVYQLVPQPAHRNARRHTAEEYGYKDGDFLPNSGHLRVRVEQDVVTVEYVRAALPDMSRHVENRTVAFRYECGRSDPTAP